MNRSHARPAGAGSCPASAPAIALVHAAAVPGQVARGLQRFRARDTLRPEAERAVRPDVHLAHVADCAGTDQFHALARVVGSECPWLPICVATFVSFARRASCARFGHGPRERLLDVDVLAEIHRGQRDAGVQVIRRRDHHAVDVVLLLEHPPVVGVPLRLGNVDVHHPLETRGALRGALQLERRQGAPHGRASSRPARRPEAPPRRTCPRAASSVAGARRRASRSACRRTPSRRRTTPRRCGRQGSSCSSGPCRRRPRSRR